MTVGMDRHVVTPRSAPNAARQRTTRLAARLCGSRPSPAQMALFGVLVQSLSNSIRQLRYVLARAPPSLEKEAAQYAGDERDDEQPCEECGAVRFGGEERDEKGCRRGEEPSCVVEFQRCSRAALEQVEFGRFDLVDDD